MTPFVLRRVDGATRFVVGSLVELKQCSKGSGGVGTEGVKEEGVREGSVEVGNDKG